jgi:gas vesicle protein
LRKIKIVSIHSEKYGVGYSNRADKQNHWAKGGNHPIPASSHDHFQHLSTRTKRMKKILITAMFASLMFSGCSSEEPKESPVEKSTSQAIQAAADKAHQVIDKTATTSQTLANKATEIKDAAKKAASDMSASIQKSSEQVTEEATETYPAPAEAHK